MFETIEDKERYFIQPYINGEYCLIRIFKSDKGTIIKASNKVGTKIKLLTKIKKQLKRSYETSRYFNYDIVLKGFLVNDTKNITSLVIYDLLLIDEYEQKNQSKRYYIRYENLILRFLTLKSKDVKLIFTYNYSESNLDAVINQFIKTNKLEKLVFRKDSPYKYDSIIIEDIWTDYVGKIIGYEEGVVIKKEFNDKQEVISETPITCIKSFKILYNNEIINISIENLIDSEKIKYYETINEWINQECNFRQYKILNKSGYIFCNIIKNKK